MGLHAKTSMILLGCLMLLACGLGFVFLGGPGGSRPTAGSSASQAPSVTSGAVPAAQAQRASPRTPLSKPKSEGQQQQEVIERFYADVLSHNDEAALALETKSFRDAMGSGQFDIFRTGKLPSASYVLELDRSAKPGLIMVTARIPGTSSPDDLALVGGFTMKLEGGEWRVNSIQIGMFDGE